MTPPEQPKPADLAENERMVDGWRIEVTYWNGSEAMKHEENVLKIISEPAAIAMTMPGGADSAEHPLYSDSDWKNPLDSKDAIFVRRFWELMESTGVSLPEWVKMFCSNVVVVGSQKGEAIRFDLSDQAEGGTFDMFFTGPGKQTLKYAIAAAAAEVQLGPLFGGLRSKIVALGVGFLSGPLENVVTYVGGAVVSAIQSQSTSEEGGESSSSPPV